MSLSADWAEDPEMALGKILHKLLVWPTPAPGTWRGLSSLPTRSQLQGWFPS